MAGSGLARPGRLAPAEDLLKPLDRTRLLMEAANEGGALRRIPCRERRARSARKRPVTPRSSARRSILAAPMTLRTISMTGNRRALRQFLCHPGMRRQRRLLYRERRARSARKRPVTCTSPQRAIFERAVPPTRSRLSRRFSRALFPNDSPPSPPMRFPAAFPTGVPEAPSPRPRLPLQSRAAP